MALWKAHGGRPLLARVCALALMCAVLQLAWPAAAFAGQAGIDVAQEGSVAVQAESDTAQVERGVAQVEPDTAQLEPDAAQDESGSTSVYVLPHLAGSAGDWGEADIGNITETVSVAPSDGAAPGGPAPGWAGADGALAGKLPATGDSAKAFAFAAVAACASLCLAAAAARRSRD